MNAIHQRILRWSWIILISLSIAGCGGSTLVQPTHPLIATEGTTEKAKVYFIRPDPGFRGVMDISLTISLAGTELLTLAKGQYTLIQLVAGSAELKVDSYTVAGPANAMTKVTTTTQFTFLPGGTHYLVFQMVSRGVLMGSVFLPQQVPKDLALDTVRGLTPVGAAIVEPISR